MNDLKIIESQSPLCVFCLSPSFSIRTSIRKPTKHPSALIWRHSDYSISATRPRFKASNRRHNNFFSKHITGSLVHRRHRTLKLDEVLRTIQEVWKSSEYIPSSRNSQETMERKASSYSTDIPSPVLLRRRLSAPETIMRKHVLAQQRSDSPDSDFTQTTDARSCQWHNDIASGSDPNLNRKRDSGLMRKSTLLRRMWSNSKPSTGSRFSGSFYEWQQSFGKSTSNHSSPEHKSQSRRSLNSNDFKTSPQRKMSPKHLTDNKKCLSPKRKVSVYNGNYDYSSFTDNSSSLDNRTSVTVTPKTDQESYSTRSTTTNYTTFSDNSDSAITNSKYSNNNSTTTSSEITKQFIEDSDNSNQEGNHNINLEREKIVKSEAQKSNESGTQTSDVTNLNVISNVQLSQSTLDLIFQQVIQDVNKSAPNEVTVNTIPVPISDKCNTQVINVQQVPSFYLKRKEDVTVDNPEHSRIVKYMISNIGTGSPYSKPAEVPQVVVPRFSALPRTSSMEVNTSSGESEDKDSDTISLVDSLEDPHSPRIESNGNHLSPILPDNSTKRKTKTPKPSSFFIPIESTHIEMKAVSDLLPSKVRDKLAKRQQKREEKISQSKSKNSSPRSDSNYISASDNQTHFVVDTSSDFNLNSTPNLPSVNYLKHKKRSKPLLPSIESFRKIKIDKREKEPKVKPVKRKSYLEYAGKHKPRNKLTPIYTSKNEYVYDTEPRRIYHKTEFSNNNKRIEILEIMECVKSSERDIFKGKSKIPVLINQKLPKINKPAFLDFDQVEISDPKLDQLIANILIDTLNNSSDKLEKLSPSSPTKSKYQQKFEIIPEEQQQVSDISNNNATENNNGEEASAIKKTNEPTYKGKAAVAVVRDENLSTIPKGWITFYMLHKNQGSPDSTSDEGKKLFDQDNNNINNNDKNIDSGSKKVVKKESSDLLSTSSEEKSVIKGKKFEVEKPKLYRVKNEKKGHWSVTVSGTNNYEYLAPELEMKLKFPNSNNNNNNKEVEKPRRWLPEISSHKRSFEPRQTKTSTRRYYLSRPNHQERDYAKLLRHFPDILSINGRSISPSRTRNFY